MFDLILFLVLMACGYFFGRSIEQEHYRSIRRRERELARLPAIATKVVPPNFPACRTQLVSGSVVISVDYFKKFLAGLRYLVGGRVTSYESLIDRARREALLRMKESAERVHASHVFNVKMETASISKGQRNAIGSVEVLAYGTAVITDPAAWTNSSLPSDHLVSTTQHTERAWVFRATLKLIGFLVILVALYLGIIALFFSGPGLSVNMRYFGDARVNETLAIALDVHNASNETVELDSIILAGTVFDDFDVVYATVTDTDVPLLEGEGYYSFQIDKEIPAGQTRAETLGFLPRRTGTFRVEFEVCNQYYDCTYFDPTITVTE